MTFSKKFSITFLSSLLLLGTGQSAYAQTADNHLKSIDDHIKQLPFLLKSTITPVVNFETSLQFAKVPDLDKTIFDSQELKDAITRIESQPLLNPTSYRDNITPVKVVAMDNKELWLQIGGGKKEIQKTITDLYNGIYGPQYPQDYPRAGATLTNINFFALMPKAFGASINNDDFEINPSAVFQQENADTPKKKLQAEMFIAYASGVGLAKTGNPVMELFAKAKKENANLFDTINNSNRQSEFMKDMTMAAIQSFDTYVLSDIYANNVPTVALNTQAGGIPTAKSISVNQLADSVTQNKALNSDWYKKMSIAAPSAVLRELLFVEASQAAIEQRIEKSNEKILATLAMQNTLLMSMAESFLQINSKLDNVNARTNEQMEQFKKQADEWKDRLNSDDLDSIRKKLRGEE